MAYMVLIGEDKTYPWEFERLKARVEAHQRCVERRALRHSLSTKLQVSGS